MDCTVETNFVETDLGSGLRRAAGHQLAAFEIDGRAISENAAQMSRVSAISTIAILGTRKKCLAEAIVSVCARSFGNWEPLPADDGSRDARSEIAQRAAREHPRQIRYLEYRGHENRGVSASRNLGIRDARGAVIAFLGAVDVWFPHKLATQLARGRAHPNGE